MDLPQVRDHRGLLTFIEGGEHTPFRIKRVFYLVEVPVGERRGGHAHGRLDQLLVAVAGSFDVIADDGDERTSFRLDEPTKALYVPAHVWREMENFSPGAVCLVLASEHFDRDDYLSHDEFIASRRPPA